MRIPPRGVRPVVPAPFCARTGVSPNEFVGPTATGMPRSSRIISRLSQKSIPSVVASKVPLVSTSPVASLSITSVGGTRPPGPISVAGGSGFPADRTVMVSGATSSVFVSPVAPGRNSLTRPPTWRLSPTKTVGAELVKTKIASDVATFASGLGSWT